MIHGMKKTLFSILIFLSLGYSHTWAQNYGNEWILPGQQYFKISTAQDGLYRIGYNELINAGVPLTIIDPQYILKVNRTVRLIRTTSLSFMEREMTEFRIKNFMYR